MTNQPEPECPAEYAWMEPGVRAKWGDIPITIGKPPFYSDHYSDWFVSPETGWMSDVRCSKLTSVSALAVTEPECPAEYAWMKYCPVAVDKDFGVVEIKKAPFFSQGKWWVEAKDCDGESRNTLCIYLSQPDSVPPSEADALRAKLTQLRALLSAAEPVVREIEKAYGFARHRPIVGTEAEFVRKWPTLLDLFRQIKGVLGDE